MTIRPFTFGDLFLLHNLSRYATHLHIEQSVLQPRSSLWTVLRTTLPWVSNGCATYVLRQQENGLARAGLIQIEIRTEGPEADVTLLTSALDAPQGHPAVWQKLLSHAAQQLVDRSINRLYTDLPDQPLVVNTFKQAGFQLYTRETVWRLAAPPAHWSRSPSTPVRPYHSADDWELCRLYSRVTPPSVQHAERGLPPDKELNGGTRPLILRMRHLGMPVSKYVLADDSGVEGCIQIVWGRAGIWLHLWADTNDPDSEAIRLLLHHALTQVFARQRVPPIYIGVRDYQGGVDSYLTDYGFAPFTDRARMVRNIWQWVQRPVSARVPALEAVREVIPGSLIIPKAVHEETEPGTQAKEETWEAL